MCSPFSNSQQCNPGSTKFRSEFGCRVVNSIISWMIIMAQLVILGTVFVSLASAGNSIHLQHNFTSLLGVLLGISCITVSCILSYVFEVEILLINTTKEDDKEDDPLYDFQYLTTLVLGCFLLLFQVKALLYVLIPRSIWEKLPSSDFWLTSGMAKSEGSTKRAAAFKINRMVENAISQHDGKILDHDQSSRLKIRSSSKRSAFGQAMLNFQASADYREKVGGVWYTIKKMWNGSLFDEEGVWIHARLYAMNISQWFIVVFFVILYSLLDVLIQEFFSTPPEPTPAELTAELTAYWAPIVTDWFGLIVSQGDDFVASIWQNITAEQPGLVISLGAGMLNSTTPEVIDYLARTASLDTLKIFVKAASEVLDIDTILNATTAILEDEQGYRYLQEGILADETDELVTQAEVQFGLGVGGIAAIIATVSLAIIWIPSSVSTIQQFRCGAIGSLRDKSFQTYRRAPDLTTVLFGSAFWGTLYCSLVILIIVGGIAFVLVWKVTRSLMLNLLAQVIGIMVTLLFKIILLMFFRKALFVGFFRKNPAGGNILLLVFGKFLLAL